MRHPAQGATGGWVMLSLVFKWFALCEFSLFDTLEMATHSSTLARRFPWMQEPGGLQSMGRKESDTTEQLHFFTSRLVLW